MNPRRSIACLLLASLFSLTRAVAHDRELGTSFRGSKNQFSFERNKKTITLRLHILINGWVVNCARTRAAVWGVGRGKERLGVPPFSKVYLINLEKGKIINYYTVTRGPYGATFSADRKVVMVDDYVIDQATGEVVTMTYYSKPEVETCPSFLGKQSK